MEMQSELKLKEKLPVKEKIFYGMGDMASNIFSAAISFYLLYFLVNVAGLKPILGTALFLVARGWDAITDYMMGRISDRTHSKLGKRRIYMVAGAIPFGICFAILWLAPNINEQWVKFLYYTMMYCLFNTAWTVVYIPYSALAANMTTDYDERTSLNGYKIVLANVGMLLGAALFSLFAEGTGSLFYALCGSVQKSYFYAAIIFGAIGALLMLFSGLFVKERNDFAEVNDKSFFQTLKEFFKLREFRSIMMTYLLSMVGFDIIMAVFLFFMNYSLGFGDPASGYDSTMSMIFVAIPIVVAMITAGLWVKLSEKYQKHKVYAVACVIMAIVLTMAIWIPKLSVGWAVAICILAGFALSAIQILPYASVPDVVDVDEYVNGVRREGAYYGVCSFMYKIASGVSVAGISAILAAFHFEESNDGTFLTQPDEALLAIRIVLGVVPGVIFLISIIFAYRANLGRDRFQQITAELDKRHQAKREALEAAAQAENTNVQNVIEQLEDKAANGEIEDKDLELMTKEEILDVIEPKNEEPQDAESPTENNPDDADKK